jgi:hypothetical protein
MKGSNKENVYSINNIDNYKKYLDNDVLEIVKKYYQINIEFYKFISEKMVSKNISHKNFIILRGFDTINNIFNYSLYYTKNIDLTIFNCQQGYYYYCEFVDQIAEEQHAYLQLSSRDASIYVYKKTIFELLNNTKKNDIDESVDKKHFDLIDRYLNIYKSILFKLFEDVKNINNNFIDKFEILCEKINLIKLDSERIDKLQKIIDLLISSIKDINLLLDVIFNILNKISKNTNKFIKKYFESITLARINELLNEENNFEFIEKLLK